MGFNKRYIDKERIVSAFKNGGAEGVSDLYKADAIIQTADSPICNYIDKIMSKNKDLEYRKNLINKFFIQLFEGLYPYK
jgi:hypothetical protein